MKFPALALCHFELFARDVAQMERFYTGSLGFVVTDRGSGEGALVFLSRNPDEHHQLVLNPRPGAATTPSPVDHFSFRVASLADLRVFCNAVSATGTQVDKVSHGTSWSIYFRDPEGHRLEIFVDTPWYVSQPCKFGIDLALTDAQLHEFTRGKVATMPGFCAVSDWHTRHRAVMA